MYKADQRSVERTDLTTMTWGLAFLIGASQSLAVIPGVSRSGISISIALLAGFQRAAAVRFSFLLSIPLIAGAGLTKIGYIFTSFSNPVFIAGFAASALAGFAAIHFLMMYVKNNSFTPFVIYRLALAVVLVMWILRG
jgi:undecaprenyl-diphosphatase